jgi:hypothetical protein
VDRFGPFDATVPHLVILSTDGVHGVLSADEIESTRARETPDIRDLAKRSRSGPSVNGGRGQRGGGGHGIRDRQDGMMPVGHSDPLPHIPELAADYDLIRELGPGGTAVVYLARDRELGRDVAIKLIRASHVQDEDAVARLVREARTVGSSSTRTSSCSWARGASRTGGWRSSSSTCPGAPSRSGSASKGALPFDEVEASC